MKDVHGWISVKDRYPKKDEEVWYYFEHTGVNRGEFYGHSGCYEGIVDMDGNDMSMGCKFPDCPLHEGCGGYAYFGGERGVLGNDVTHWMEDSGQEKPEKPEII